MNDKQKLFSLINAACDAKVTGNALLQQLVAAQLEPLVIALSENWTVQTPPTEPPEPQAQ